MLIKVSKSSFFFWFVATKPLINFLIVMSDIIGVTWNIDNNDTTDRIKRMLMHQNVI